MSRAFTAFDKAYSKLVHAADNLVYADMVGEYDTKSVVDDYLWARDDVSFKEFQRHLKKSVKSDAKNLAKWIAEVRKAADAVEAVIDDCVEESCAAIDEAKEPVDE